jgi:mannose-6-phosphate isomerase-like protein (cupin superfamily)
MTTETITSLVRNFSTPDEIKEFSNGRIEFVTLEDVAFAKVTLKPGWRWSRDIKPTMKSELCESHHIQYVISGRLRVLMDDGTEHDLSPGDVCVVAPGHDAWVLGNEPFVAIDFTGMKEYRKEHTG